MTALSIIEDRADSSMVACATTFAEHGRCTIPISIAELVPSIIADVKRLIQDSNNGGWRDIYIPRLGLPGDEADDGLIRKFKVQGNGEPADCKWFFHYRNSLADVLHTRGVSTLGHESLLNQCSALFNRCLTTTRSFVEELASKEFRPDLLHGFDTATLNDLHVLRFVIYDHGDVVARPHTDRCFLTLHLAENRPGLRIGTENEPYDVLQDTALIFPGQRLEMLTSGRYRALSHCAVDEQPDAPDERWAVIFFTHCSPQELRAKHL